MSWLEQHPTLHRVLLILYYLAVILALIAMYGRGDFSYAALCVSGLLVNLIERIDHWAAVAPEAIAHISGDRTLTYGELRRRSDALASYLTEAFR